MPHHPPTPLDASLTRRELLCRSGMGLGSLALGALLAESGGLARAATGSIPTPLAARPPQFAPRAKRVIHLFMNGGPSQVDTFDPKPALTKYSGKADPARPADRAEDRLRLRLPLQVQEVRPERARGQRALRQTAEHADDLCVIRSMHADVPNHEPSLMLMNCGDARQPRPSVGSWVLYGLGTENQNLPGFVVMCPGGYPIAESQNWRSGFLPGIYQGTYIDTKHTDIEKLIENIRNRRVTPRDQRDQLDLLLPEPRAPGAPRRRGRARGAHPVVRAGLPDADRGQRRLRHRARARAHPRPVRPRRPRPAAPDRPPAPRAGRPLRPGLARRVPALGHPRRHRGEPPQPGRPVRPAHRRPAHRPQAARDARGHAGDLGRRVRPHADRRAAHPAPTPAR